MAFSTIEMTVRNQFQIVGIVSDARVNDIREAAPPIIYFPIAQKSRGISTGLEYAPLAEPKWIAEQVRQAVASVDPRISHRPTSPLWLMRSKTIWRNNAWWRALLPSSVCWLLLSRVLGLYGVMSYLVSTSDG